MKDINIQAQNKVTIIGKLLDITFGEGNLGDGRHYERATATVRTTQTYGGREEISEVPVSIFATQYTSTGKQNPAWASLQGMGRPTGRPSRATTPSDATAKTTFTAPSGT